MLLVEDEALVRNLGTHVLQEQGYSVLVASNGVEAMQLVDELNEGKIHLLLTDVVMSEMGGSELAERFRSSHPEAKVLYCSGYTADAMAHNGILEPETAFLSKPFSPPALALALKVREVLDS